MGAPLLGLDKSVYASSDSLWTSSLILTGVPIDSKRLFTWNDIKIFLGLTRVSSAGKRAGCEQNVRYAMA